MARQEGKVPTAGCLAQGRKQGISRNSEVGRAGLLD